MRQKLRVMVFNGPRAKTKTVLELACKKDPKSSIIQTISERLVHFVSIYCVVLPSPVGAIWDNKERDT